MKGDIMNTNRWVDRWRLRRIIALLAIPLNKGGLPGVHDFAKTMEATEIMTRDMKKGDEVTMTTSRGNLLMFIRYMTSMHDAKLSRLATARVGLATLMESDETAIGGGKAEVLLEEWARNQQGKTLKVVDAGGKSIKVKT
jgi:hypothetical protein